jgi:hypothetical protein
MSVLKSVRSTTFLAALSVLVVVAGTLFGANIASADSIQVQGYQRASQTEACVAQVGETPWQASWGPDATWKPGWEQWANKGAGGWVCTRSITWAKTPVPVGSGAPAHPSAGCVYLGRGGYLNFQGGWSLAIGALVYTDPACSLLLGTWGYYLVYAPAGFDATTVCLEAFGVVPDAYVSRIGTSDVFTCNQIIDA